MMHESKNFIDLSIPEGYDFRYSLSFLIARKAVNTGKTRMEIKIDIVTEMAVNDNTAMGLDMLNKYIGEKQEERTELSDERKVILQKYFGLPDAELILTEKVRHWLGFRYGALGKSSALL